MTAEAPSLFGAGQALARQHRRQLLLGTRGCAVLAVLAILSGLIWGWPAAWSALLAVGIVWASFSISALVLARVAEKAPDSLLLMSIGLFCLKFLVLGFLLLGLGLPGWLEPLPTAVAALAAVVLWQIAQFQTTAKSRILLYTPERQEAK